MQKIDKALDAKIRDLTGMTHKSGIADDDVFIIGHPKSGHTWFQNLVAGAVYGIDLEYTPYSMIWDVVPEHNWPYFKRYSTPMFFKTHDIPKPKYRRVVYMLRDGRDVMVSYYHYNKTMRKQEGKKTDFMKVVQGKQGIYPFKKWHEHVEMWLANPHNAELLLVKYEDLLEDPVAEMQRFCEFIGIERDPAHLAQVADQASFGKMREKEKQGGLEKPDWPWPDWPSWPKSKFFMRRGKAGSHKDEMPEDVLEAFMRDAEPTLRKLGYLQ